MIHYAMGSNMSNFNFLDLPDELQEHVFRFLDLKTLLNCRQTCKKICETLSSDRVWRNILCRKIGLKNLALCGVTANVHLKWQWSFLLAKHGLLGKNLLKSAELLSSWNVLSSGGDGWTVECPPHGADPLPEEAGVSSCFATSFHSCSKQQVIDLWKCGFAPGFLDELQPKIIYGEWYAGRFDCGCVYELKLELINKDHKRIMIEECRETIQQWEGSAWNKIHKELKDYGPGLRYIKFFNGGMDLLYWKGHYGAKMAGPFLIITL